MTAPSLKQTPLNAAHRRMGGRMVDFGGWDMPVQYPPGTLEEHLRTRTRAGLFDVSHMGEFEVRGADAISFVNRLYFERRDEARGRAGALFRAHHPARHRR